MLRWTTNDDFYRRYCWCVLYRSEIVDGKIVWIRK